MTAFSVGIDLEIGLKRPQISDVVHTGPAKGFSYIQINIKIALINYLKILPSKQNRSTIIV